MTVNIILTHFLFYRLVKTLQKYVTVDIYGKCGPLVCPRRDMATCTKMLDEEYKFYLSFENSLCYDYLTEKLIRGLK